MPFDLEDNERQIVYWVKRLDDYRERFVALCQERSSATQLNICQVQLNMVRRLVDIQDCYDAIAKLWKKRLECLEADYRQYQLYAAGVSNNPDERNKVIGDSLAIYQQIQDGKVAYAQAIARYRATEGMKNLVSASKLEDKSSYFWTCKIADRKM